MEVKLVHHSEMEILQKTETSMVRAMCGVQLKDKKSKDLMSMLGLNETTDQLDMVNCLLEWSWMEER